MRQASRQASRLWKLPLMLWKVEQNRHLARMRQASRQASRQAFEAGLEAMEIAARQRRDLAKVREDSRQASTPIHT